MTPNVFPFPSLVEGVHVFEATGVDGAGNSLATPPISVTTVVDTVPPVVNITSSPPRFTNLVNHTVCVSLADATATLASTTLTLDGTPLNISLTTGCVNVTALSEGNHTLIASAVDLAGNVAVPVFVWFVVDVTPPSHVTTLSADKGCFTKSLLSGPVTVCNSSTAATATVTCVQSTSAAVPVIAPCRLYWYIVNLGSAACSTTSTANTSASGSWTLLSGTVVDPSTIVAAALQSTPLGHFSLHTQARDDAGNVDGEAVVEWWTDTAAPPSPVLLGSPDGVTTLTTAPFSFKVMTDSAPGQLSYVYVLTVNGQARTLPGGNPAVPDPTPNTATTQVTLSGLTTGEVYSISVWSVSQARVRGCCDDVPSHDWRPPGIAYALRMHLHTFRRWEK